jgi:hypothetical protein
VPAVVRSPDPAPLALETLALSACEVKEEDLTKIHRASRIVSQAEVRAVAAAWSQLPDAPRSNEAIRSVLRPAGGLGLGETIVRRGSTRVFARQPIGADELATIITASTMPLRADFPRHVDIYLIVNLVEGLAPGAYYFQRESGTFDLLKSGDFRGEAGYLCLEQPLGADASALICYMADLERVLAALGNRGYRDVHLEAGLLGGRTYLAAYALGHGATGLTFYDNDTTKFFSPHSAGKSPILMVALGVPRSSIRPDAKGA